MAAAVFTGSGLAGSAFVASDFAISDWAALGSTEFDRAESGVPDGAMSRVASFMVVPTRSPRKSEAAVGAGANRCPAAAVPLPRLCPNSTPGHRDNGLDDVRVSPASLRRPVPAPGVAEKIVQFEHIGFEMRRLVAFSPRFGPVVHGGPARRVVSTGSRIPAALHVKDACVRA
ncbi:hypothetical protein [Rhodovulum sp. PH10]|uniref:hypothetical protein n=1 Tax=Rhodovulum sp. PH10 TaxID=1187851 RepID=UPI00178C7628|nr:hypothetical protein [Rhodovulum sp. PH10]